MHDQDLTQGETKWGGMTDTCNRHTNTMTSLINGILSPDTTARGGSGGLASMYLTAPRSLRLFTLSAAIGYEPLLAKACTQIKANNDLRLATAAIL